MLPFRFELTEDLPQCIHTSVSELTYTFTARLYDVTGNFVTTQATLHPTRYIGSSSTVLRTHSNDPADGAEGPQRGESLYSLLPTHWSEPGIIQAYFWLERTVIRKSDTVLAQVHIPPPDPVLIEKGLQLQSVEAFLIRVIQSHPEGRLYSDVEVLERVMAPSSSIQPSNAPHMIQTSVAYSGKSCRFHSQRAVHLHFVVHPGSTLGSQEALGADFDMTSTRHGLDSGVCESISQDTALHSIRFVLCFKVLLRDALGAPRDLITKRHVKILPCPAGMDRLKDALPARKEKLSFPSYFSAITAHPSNDAEIAALFNNQVEYDGYDDAMQSSSSRAMEIANPLALSQLSTCDHASVEYQALEPEGPPPSMSEHVNDTRLPDDLELNEAPPLPTHLPMFSSSHETSSFSTSEITLPWTDDYTAPPADEPDPPPLDEDTENTSCLPPSYADATPTRSLETQPPGYFQSEASTLSSALAAIPSEPNPEDRTVFPPLYEA